MGAGGASAETADLVLRLAGLSDVVAGARASFDGERRITDDLFDELAAIGVFRLWLPAAVGGLGLSALEFMDVVEAASAVDGTVGWLVGNGGGMSRIGAFLPVESTSAIFDDPKAFVVSSTAAMGRAVRVDGGHRVTGRWPFGSGTPHATWFSPVCAVERDGRPTDEAVFVCAPRADVVVHDNWHVSGLCGTGSVDFELRDVFVADEFTHAFQPEPLHEGVLYRLPTRAIYSWTVATVPLGIARGAIGEFVRVASARRGGGAVPFAERELVQSQLGQIEARVGAGRAYLRHAMSALLNAVESGTDLVLHRVNFRLACTYASQAALSSIDLLTEMAGAISISRSCLLERYERDARAAAKHIAMSPAAYITGGKHSLGLDLSNSSY